MDQFSHQEQELFTLARQLNITPAQLRQELSGLGLKTLKAAAEEHAEQHEAARPNRGAPLADAARALMPSVLNLAVDANAKVPGYLYVLYDGVTGQSKIGCTKNDGQRQRAIMGAHSSVLANVLNAKVDDMRAAEKQCHRHFAASRKNGEWFSADLQDIVAYIGSEVDWERLSMECMARMAKYIVGCRLGDMVMARAALTGSNYLASQRGDLSQLQE